VKIFGSIFVLSNQFQKDTFGHPCAMTSDFCESNFRYKFLELHVQNNLYHLDFLTRLISDHVIHGRPFANLLALLRQFCCKFQLAKIVCAGIRA